MCKWFCCILGEVACVAGTFNLPCSDAPGMKVAVVASVPVVAVVAFVFVVAMVAPVLVVAVVASVPAVAAMTPKGLVAVPRPVVVVTRTVEVVVCVVGSDRLLAHLHLLSLASLL